MSTKKLLCMQLGREVAEQIKTYDLMKSKNFRKISKPQCEVSFS